MSTTTQQLRDLLARELGRVVIGVEASVDALVIALWPLVTRHNWTYCDLLNVMRPALGRPDVYPCDREQSLATHCVNALGLRKDGKGKTAKDGRPVGWEVAGKIIRAKG